VVHKQFNSPIGLYSENNIEKTIQQSAPNSVPYKRTVLYDPLKSETYRAIQEETYDVGNPHEVPQPVQTKVFHPTSRGVPQKSPSNYQATNFRSSCSDFVQFGISHDPSRWIFIDVSISSQNLDTIESELCCILSRVENNSCTVLGIGSSGIHSPGNAVEVTSGCHEDCVHISHFGLDQLEFANSLTKGFPLMSIIERQHRKQPA
uniref:Zasp-like motif domain-containing protein n=1 Tax=Phlebotomus papatasi TaxID=29031 RepID=A0A1B0EXJ2_PHLPP